MICTLRRCHSSVLAASPASPGPRPTDDQDMQAPRPHKFTSLHRVPTWESHQPPTMPLLSMSNREKAERSSTRKENRTATIWRRWGAGVRGGSRDNERSRHPWRCVGAERRKCMTRTRSTTARCQPSTRRGFAPNVDTRKPPTKACTCTTHMSPSGTNLTCKPRRQTVHREGWQRAKTSKRAKEHRTTFKNSSPPGSPRRPCSEDKERRTTVLTK